MLIPFSKAFPNFTKNFPKSPKLINKYDILYQQKPDIRKYFQSIEEYLGKYSSLDDKKESLDILKDASSEALYNSFRSFYSKSREDEIFHNLKNSFKKDELKDVTLKGFFNTKLESSSQASEESFRNLVFKMEKNIHQISGNEGLKVFQDYFIDFDKSSKIYGFKEIDFYKAFKNPDLVNNPILKSIGKVYKEIDTDLIKNLHNFNAIGILDDYVVPLNPNFFVVKSLGVKGLKNHILKYANNIDENNASEIAKDIYNNIIKSSGVTNELNFTSRRLTFNSIEDEFNYYKGITDLSGDSNTLIKSIFEHKENLLRNAYLYKEFGKNPQETINKIFSKVLQENKEDVNFIEKVQEIHSSLRKSLDLAQGKNYSESPTMQYLASAIEKYTSGIYGATRGLPRNFLQDFTHGALFNKAFLSKETIGGYYFTRVLKPFSVLVGRFGELIKKDNTLKKELDELLDIFNFSSSNSSFFGEQGFRSSNIGLDNVNPNVSSSLEKFFKNLNIKAGKFNHLLHNITGNTFHFDVTTALNLMKNSKGFTYVLNKAETYEDFLKIIGNQGEEYFKNIFEIGEKEFYALKSLDKTLIKSNSLIKKLGFKNEHNIILPQSIKNLSDSKIKDFKRVGESVEEFRERLEMSYYSYLTHQRHLGQTVLTRTNKILNRGLMKGSFIDLILRPFALFANITQGQYDALRVGLSLQMYGNPYQISFKSVIRNKEYLTLHAKAAVFYASAATTVVWMKDILDGKTPRTIGPEEFLLIGATSGYGGILLNMFGSLGFEYSGVYGGTALGSYLDQGFNALNNPHSFGKFLQTTSGVGRIWYAKGIIDYVMREALLDNHEQARLERFYRDQLGSSIYLR